MKKAGKILLLSSLTIATVGTIALNNISTENLQKLEAKTDIQAYNHKPNNILDNIFEKDGKTILPFIFEDSDQTITKTYLVEQFQKAGKSIQNLSSLKDIIVTGNEVKTADTTYTVWIYGDVNADGYVDVFDAQRALNHYVFEDAYTLTGNSAVTANVYNTDAEIDVFDAQRMLRFYVGLEPKLVLKEPLSTIEQNIELPKIELKGNDPQIVRLDDPYVEAGATVTDNKDKNLVAQIDSTGVDTSKIGTYYVTYTAIDSDENKREVTREVKVVDYATSLTLTNAPTQTRYGEELDLSGMTVKARMKSFKETDPDKTVLPTEYEVKGYNATKVGPQTITISYEGKNTTFTVEVKDYQTGIEVEFPKTEYKYQEDLDLTEAKARTKMASGAFGKWEPITEDMIFGYDKEQTIKQTLIITYSDEQTEVEVEVKDYATDMNIVKWPTKQDEQKYGKDIDLTGMIINATMAKAGTKTLTQDDYEVVGYDKEKLGSQTITIEYAGFAKPLTVTVKNYVTGIRTKIATGAKTIYVVGEAFDFTGIQIEKVMAAKVDGVDSVVVSMDDIVVSPLDKRAVFGMNEITMLYETNETEDGRTTEFQTSHKITVLKHLANIQVKPQKLEGYAHEPFSFGTILSGEQEEPLSADQVKVFIADKDGTEITNSVTIEKLPLNENGEMPINFNFPEKGDYRVTFYVGNNFADSTIKSQEQTIHITYNPIVETATILEASEVEISVRKEKSKERSITFKNAHGDTLTDEVLATSVEFEPNAYLTYTKMTNGHPVTSTEENIDMVRITGKEQGANFIRMTVNKGTPQEKSIRLASAVIGPEAKKIIGLKNVGGTTIGDTITLYQEEQLENMGNLLTYHDIVYTLIEISLIDEDGDAVVLKGSDLGMGTATANKKLGVRYTGYRENNPLISAYLFASNLPGSEPVSSDEPVKYLGIALSNGTEPEEVSESKLMIEYYNALNNPQELTMKVEPLRIKELLITEANKNDVSGLPTGYNHEEFLVGSITSGPRQKDVTIDDFYTGSVPNYTVKDMSGNDAMDKVKVTFGYDNVDREVELKATTSQVGKYMITCWVTVAGNRIPLTQTIETVKNPEVVSAEVADTSALVVGKLTTRSIIFKNKYGETVDVNRASDVDANVVGTGVNAELVNVVGGPTGKMTQVQLYATNLGGASIVVTVKGKQLPTISFDTKEDISIEVMGTPEDVSGVEQRNGKYVIRLYETNTGNKDNVVTGSDGFIYTLIPIRINKGGTKGQVYGSQLVMQYPGDGAYVEGDVDPSLPFSHHVVVTYSGDTDYLIYASMLQADGTTQINGVEAPYLGIALMTGGLASEADMIGKTITISYPGADPINIEVISSTTP